MEYADAAKVMKAALEKGANFWNGVSRMLVSRFNLFLRLNLAALGNLLRPAQCKLATLAQVLL